MKRLLLFGLCICLSACQQKQTSPDSLLSYLPNNALLVAKSSAFESLQKYDNQHVAATSLTAIFPDFFGQISELKQNTSGQLSFHPEGKDGLSHMWITHQKPALVDSVLADTLSYAKTQLLQLKTDPPTFYASWDSLHVYSPSKLLVEQSIRLRNAPNTIDVELEKLYTNTKEKHTFFVHKNISPFFDTLFSDSSPVPWNEWSNWTAFVPNVTVNGVAIRAYGVLPSTGESRLSPLTNQMNSLQDLAKYIPSSVKSVQAFAFDYMKFTTGSRRFQASHNLPKTPLDSLLIEATQVAQLQLGNDTVVVIKSAQESEELANQLTQQSNAQYSIGRQTLFELAPENQKERILPPLFQNKKHTHAAYVSEHVYLSTSKATLESVLYALEKEDVLANNSRFASYAKKLPRRSSLWAWAAPAYFENNLKKALPRISKTDFESFLQADYVGTVEGEVFYVTMSLQQPSESETSSQSVEAAGTVTFNSPIKWGPYAVRNHKTQELEWLVQDEENRLYLLNTLGKVLWKKPLDGAVLGAVHQVDLYRNKRLQFAFTTSKSFQVLDRNGKAVSGFTKSGMGTNSTLGIFDYDNQRDYRIVLSTSKTLAMYNRQMKKISGWRKTKLSGSLAYAPKHIRIGSRDYVALVYKSGKGELLHRTGKTRINIPADVTFTQDIFPYQDGFVSIDDKNRLVQIGTSGKITTKALPFETRYTLAANKNTLVTQTENKITINNQLVELDYGVYAPPKIQVVNNRTYILVWDNQAGKVHVFNRDAKLLDSFPVLGERWATLGQGVAGSGVYLATRSNTKDLRFYRIP